MASRSVLVRRGSTLKSLLLKQSKQQRQRWQTKCGRSLPTATNEQHEQQQQQQQQQQQNADTTRMPSLALFAALTVTGAAHTLHESSYCEENVLHRTSVRRQPRKVLQHRKRGTRVSSLDEKYKIDWTVSLGEGAYGSVHPARVAATGEKVALKKISRTHTSSSSFKTETDALLCIYENGGHPNILGLRDTYMDHSHYYLIMDLVSGGEMFDQLRSNGAYTENDASRLIYETLSALSFLHGVGVVHADLKPENLLLCSKNRREGTIKVVDFGCAVTTGDVRYQKRTKPTGETRKSGTLGYWSPERFEKGYKVDASLDIWSLGVILYIMLTGVHPFDLDGTLSGSEMEATIKRNPRPPLEGITDHLSPSAVDAIKRMMEPDPSKRSTAYEMLQHPWVRGETASHEKMKDSDKRLSRFKDLRNQVDAGIFAVLVSQGHKDVRLSEARPDALQRNRKNSGGNGRKNDLDMLSHIMKKAFDTIDSEGKGFVTSDDLREVVKNHVGKQLSSSDTEGFLATQEGTSELLSLTDFEHLSRSLQHRHFPHDHVIFNAGDDGDAMYFLSSGRVKIQTRKGQQVSLLRSGDFFGEGSLLSGEYKRFTTAKCVTPVIVLEIRKEDFDRYVASSKATKNELQLKWRARALTYAKNMIRLQKNFCTITYKKGDVVYQEGDRGIFIYRVENGTLEVSYAGKAVHRYEGGDSFGESAILFDRPRTSVVTCVSDNCTLHRMRGEDFLAVVNSSPDMAAALRNMCRKRLFKKAVKTFSLKKNRGVSDDDIVAAFRGADIDNNGALTLEEVQLLMHRMDPNLPLSEIRALLKFIDVDEDGMVSLEEFKQLFRQFEDEKA